MIKATLVFAVALDLILGDPRYLPHPIRWIGNFIYFWDRAIKKKRTKWMGFLGATLTLSISGFSAWFFLLICNEIHHHVHSIGSVILIFYCIAIKDLEVHAQMVYHALQRKDLSDARNKIGMIVGRDTQELDEKQIVKACIETISESYIDGIITPLFYAFLGGPIASLLAKTVNTLDSMIGYKNERYREIGFFSAKLDDLINFIPARYGILFLIPATWIHQGKVKNAWQIFKRDRLKHPSPNSAHAESFMAGALEIQLGGLSYYKGIPSQKPLLGDSLKTPEIDLIKRTLKTIRTAAILFILFHFAIFNIFSLFY